MVYFIVYASICTSFFCSNWVEINTTKTTKPVYVDVDSKIARDEYIYYNVKYYNEKAKEYIIVTIQAVDDFAGVVKTCTEAQYEKDNSLAKIDTYKSANNLKELTQDSLLYDANKYIAKVKIPEKQEITNSKTVQKTKHTNSTFKVPVPAEGTKSGQNTTSPVSDSEYGNGSRYSNGSGGGNPVGDGGRSRIDEIKEPDFGPYMRELQSKIKMNWDPPKGDESKHVVLLFKIAKDGRLLSCSVLKSSGLQNADDAALKAVKLAAPFRPLPSEYKGENIDIQFTFDYNVFGNKRY